MVFTVTLLKIALHLLFAYLIYFLCNYLKFDTEFFKIVSIYFISLTFIYAYDINNFIRSYILAPDTVEKEMRNFRNKFYSD